MNFDMLRRRDPSAPNFAAAATSSPPKFMDQRTALLRMYRVKFSLFSTNKPGAKRFTHFFIDSEAFRLTYSHCFDCQYLDLTISAYKKIE